MFKEKVVDLNDFKKEAKKRERKAMIENGATFIKENLIWIAPVGAAAVGIGKKALSAHKTNTEIKFKQRTIYDRSLGRYVELKRPLTSKQSLEIERRKANGEKLHSILNDMGVLKR